MSRNALLNESLLSSLAADKEPPPSVWRMTMAVLGAAFVSNSYIVAGRNIRTKRGGTGR